MPLPVGPVTSTMPLGLRMIWRNRRRIVASMPIFCRSSCTTVRSSTRMTTDSPNIVGSTLTRRSTELPPTLSSIRPSCGSRRSAMSSSAMTLIRVVMALARCRGGGTISYRTPSARTRILNSSSNGSKWMSLAWSLIARSSTMLSSLRTGAAEAISSSEARSNAPLLVASFVEPRLLELVDHLFDAVLLVGVVPLDRLLDVVQIRDGPAHVVTQKVPQVVQGGHVLRIGHGDGENVVLERDGHDLVDVGHRLRNDFQHVGRDVRLRQADDRHAPLLGQGFGHLRLGDEAHADRHLADDLTGTLLLLFQNVPELVLGEISEVDQDLSQTSLCHALARRRVAAAPSREQPAARFRPDDRGN